MSVEKQFVYSIDHCFQIKNKGTIITGTILKGKIEVGQDIFFPELQAKKTIKEMQMFKKPLKRAFKGDRVGMLVKNLESTELERTIACLEPNQISSTYGGIFLIRKIKYYKSDIMSNSKIFIIVGNQGTSGKYIFFGNNKDVNCYLNQAINTDKDCSNKNIEEGVIDDDLAEKIIKDNTIFDSSFFTKREFDYQEQLDSTGFAIIKLDSKLLCTKDSLVIGIHVETDISNKVNRIAFYGRMIQELEFDSNKEVALSSNLNNLKGNNQSKNINTNINTNSIMHRNSISIIKHKFKEGRILRMSNNYTAIMIEMFQKDSNISDFIGKKIYIEEISDLKENDKIKLKEISGTIISEFGQSGKVKVDFNKNMKELSLEKEDNTLITWKELKLITHYTKKIKVL